jgi:predicted Zn-dependent peptidase
MIERKILNSGAELISEKIEGAESFALGIYVRAGSVHSDKEKAGIAHALEHIIFRRSTPGDEASVAEQFEELGAYINAYTSNEYTCFYVRALNEHFEKSFTLLADLVLKANFTEGDVEKEKDIILEEIDAAADEPEDNIFDISDELIFKEHPFGNSILGSEETLDNISYNDIKEFYDEYYRADNILIVTSGNIEHNTVENIAIKNIENKEIEEKTGDYIPEYSYDSNEHTQTIKQELNQAHILSGWVFDAKYRDIAVLSSVLIGDGMSSRMYRSIREEEGLAYSIYSNIQGYSTKGIFYLYTACQSDKRKKAIDKINENINNLLAEGVNDSEFNRAKTMLKSGFIMEMEDLSARINFYAKHKILYGELKNIQESIKIITDTNINEINEFHKSLFAEKNKFLTLVLPKKSK